MPKATLGARSSVDRISSGALYPAVNQHPAGLIGNQVGGLPGYFTGELERPFADLLITSCQVSEKPNNGPVIAQIRTTATAATKVGARPAARDVTFAISPNSCELLLRSFFWS